MVFLYGSMPNIGQQRLATCWHPKSAQGKGYARERPKHASGVLDSQQLMKGADVAGTPLTRAHKTQISQNSNSSPTPESGQINVAHLEVFLRIFIQSTLLTY